MEVNRGVVDKVREAVENLKDNPRKLRKYIYDEGIYLLPWDHEGEEILEEIDDEVFSSLSGLKVENGISDIIFRKFGNCQRKKAMEKAANKACKTKRREKCEECGIKYRRKLCNNCAENGKKHDIPSKEVESDDLVTVYQETAMVDGVTVRDSKGGKVYNKLYCNINNMHDYSPLIVSQIDIERAIATIIQNRMNNQKFITAIIDGVSLNLGFEFESDQIHLFRYGEMLFDLVIGENAALCDRVIDIVKYFNKNNNVWAHGLVTGKFNNAFCQLLKILKNRVLKEKSYKETVSYYSMEISAAKKYLPRGDVYELRHIPSIAMYLEEIELNTKKKNDYINTMHEFRQHVMKMHGRSSFWNSSATNVSFPSDYE